VIAPQQPAKRLDRHNFYEADGERVW